MARTKIGSNAQFTGGSKSLVAIADRVYAYSGDITGTGAGSATVEALNFSTGKEYIKANFQFTHNLASGHDLYYTIEFNGVTIVSIKEDDSGTEYWPLSIKLIIPPLTLVVTKFGSNTTGYTGQNNIIGRVYA